ncbi:histamine H2 receptor-like [Actinia tenebrosa]|uniref:Histamine H2 receptor-like n=1 Tax=Actinia tenebrosa TaxID=6105 RepID=A0A6P8HRR4_ACTTE|nr:histamine H2 receptor-like [Actinia tenebrosa]
MVHNSTFVSSKSDTTIVLMCFGVIVVAIVIFTGNCLVIASIALNKRLQTRTSAFIASLAIGDLLISVLVVPLIIISNIVGPRIDYHKGLRYCHATIAVAVSLMFNAVANLGAVSLDRYLAIMSPLRYKTIMRRRLIAGIIASVWIFSTVFGFIPYMGWREVMFAKSGLFCQVTLNLDRSYIITVCTAAVFPSVFMVVAYYRIFKTARMHSTRISAAMNSIMLNYSRSSTVTSSFVREAKAAKMVALVLGSFIIFWTPLFLIMIIDTIKTSFVNSYLYAGAVMFATINSALNPAIYAAMNREFRSTFICLLRCKRPTRVAPVPH